MAGETDGAVLLIQGTTDSLAYPPVSVGNEFHPTLWLKFVQSTHHADIAFLNEIEKRHSAPTIATRYVNNQTQVGVQHLSLGACELLLCVRPRLGSVTHGMIVGLGLLCLY
jgi:hypothetical protein